MCVWGGGFWKQKNNKKKENYFVKRNVNAYTKITHTHNGDEFLDNIKCEIDLKSLASKKTKFVFNNRCCDPSVRPARVMWSIGIIPHTKQKHTPMMMMMMSSIKTSKGLCPALVAPVQPPNLIEYKKNIKWIYFQKDHRNRKHQNSSFFYYYLPSNSRRLDIFDRVCVCRWLPLSLSLSCSHGNIKS